MTYTRLTVPQWERDDVGDATPVCPVCEKHLGVSRAVFSTTGRDMWLCDDCGEFERA